MLELVNLLADTAGTTGGNFNEAWQIIDSVVNKTLIPILYAVLGLFLVVKGALLGMQIVKAADEPQVRQEKIGSLKWLVIGCAIAFGVVFASDMLIDFFADTFGATTEF